MTRAAVLLFAPLWILASAAQVDPCTADYRLAKKREAALRKAVSGFWTAWAARDFSKVSDFVLPEDRSRFQTLRRFPIRKWSIDEIAGCSGTPNEVRVVVAVERFEAMMGYFQWQHHSRWRETGAGWKLRLVDAPVAGIPPHVQE